MLKDRWLLPEGAEELLPAEARRLEALRRRLLDLLACWGYELVMPPLIEYLESLLTGTGSELDLQTFKLTDQLTGRLMGVRPDMTPQAARIDAHFLKRETPVRLCYSGSVLRTRPDEFGGSREPIQLGAELFGHAGAESDAEVLSLMVATLRAAGVGAMHLDLGHVGVFRAVAAEARLTVEQEADVFDALQRKARGELESLVGQYRLGVEHGRRLTGLLDLCGGAEVLALARTHYQGLPAVQHALDNLEAVSRLVTGAGDVPTLHYDLAELSGYGYYTGVVFSAFVPGHGRAVAKGGRYDGIGQAFGRNRAATGFGTDLRLLLKLAAAEETPVSGILAPASGDAALRQRIAQLRAQGERVVQQLPGAAATAAQLGCDRELVSSGGQWQVRKV
jgi:ATP phosphoribosyltransferase regulatory subunit